MGRDMTEVLLHQRAELREQIHIERCKIATTANDESDDVWVTFPNGPSPLKREIVDFWRCGIAGDGSPRYPTRNETGIILHLDTGELWLVF